jgi:hypothetical protein
LSNGKESRRPTATELDVVEAKRTMWGRRSRQPVFVMILAHTINGVRERTRRLRRRREVLEPVETG